MAIAADGSIEVPSDAATVFRYTSTLANLPAWLPGVSSASQTSPGAVAAGTTFAIVIAGPTGPISATGQVTACDPEALLAVAATSAIGRLRGSARLSPTAAGTLVTVSLELEPAGMYRLAAGMVSRELQRELPRALTRLRQELAA